MSGAGMSISGPMNGARSLVKRRVTRATSACDMRPRVAADAALGAAVREPQQRALPGHPHRERRAFAEVDARRRSECRPSSARAPTSAARGRRGTSGRSRRRAGPAARGSPPAPGSAAARRRARRCRRTAGPARAASAPARRAACPTRAAEPNAGPRPCEDCTPVLEVVCLAWQRMPGEGIEPPRPQRAPGFKPGASTSSATPAGAAQGYAV